MGNLIRVDCSRCGFHRELSEGRGFSGDRSEIYHCLDCRDLFEAWSVKLEPGTYIDDPPVDDSCPKVKEHVVQEWISWAGTTITRSSDLYKDWNNRKGHCPQCGGHVSIEETGHWD